LAVLTLVVVPLFKAGAEGPDVLQQKTQKAEDRINRWDEEEKAASKRGRWEIPLASALIITGAAFATRNQPYIYASSFAAATGLIVHFWTHRGGRNPNEPKLDPEPSERLEP
jgi:hypothetical protein